MRRLSPVAASGGHSSSRCAGLSLSRPLLLRSTGSRRAGSAAVPHGLSRSVACGIFPDQGSNLCPLHWQADSQPLRHQGSPKAEVSLIMQSLTIHHYAYFCVFVLKTFDSKPINLGFYILQKSNISKNVYISILTEPKMTYQISPVRIIFDL